MTKDTAEQIAKLLNRRNKLAKQYTSEIIFSEKDSYVFILDANDLVACAQTKKVQWYQCEILHVSVNEKFTGQGKGAEILALAEDKACKKGARLLQCTIRSDNEKSVSLFKSSGYKEVNQFHNSITSNKILVFQKNISELQFC